MSEALWVVRGEITSMLINLIIFLLGGRICVVLWMRDR